MDDYLARLSSYGNQPGYGYQAPSVDNLGNLLSNGNSNAITDGFTLPANPGIEGNQGIFNLDSFLGKTGENGYQPGWAIPALSAASGLANSFIGLKQYGLAKKSLRENKRQFNLNFGAQRDSYNTQLADRQRARVSADPGGYESVSSYLDKNRIQ